MLTVRVYTKNVLNLEKKEMRVVEKVHFNWDLNGKYNSSYNVYDIHK